MLIHHSYNICLYSLAMKHHPDRFSDPEKKTAAKQKFQTISSAYSVLRDGKYDNK